MPKIIVHVPTVKELLAILSQKLEDHIHSDAEGFRRTEDKLNRIEASLLHLHTTVTKLDALKDVASKAGRNTALKWSSLLGSVIPIVLVIFYNACSGAHVPVPAPTTPTVQEQAVPNAAP